jgi:hypothetical protein
MRKRIKYTDEPMDLMPVADFLPAPRELKLRARRVKVTLEVGEPTVELFRKTAGKSHADYRALMSELLDFYATHQKVKAS